MHIHLPELSGHHPRLSARLRAHGRDDDAAARDRRGGRAADGAARAGAGDLAVRWRRRCRAPIRRPRPPATLALGLLIAQEVTAGILIGAMARIIMSALQVAGTLIATQTGLAYAQTVDPTQQGEQSAVIGNFLSLLGVVLIFATDLHHLAIGAIAGSYHLIAAGRGAADRRHGRARRSAWSAAPSRSASSSQRRSSSSASRCTRRSACWRG